VPLVHRGHQRAVLNPDRTLGFHTTSIGENEEIVKLFLYDSLR